MKEIIIKLISRYRPDLVDWPSIQECSAEESNEIAFNIFETEFNIPPIMTAKESILLENTEIKVWHHYLEQICEVFRGEIPHVKHPKMDFAEYQQQKKQNTTSMADFARLHRIAAAKRAEAAKNPEEGAVAPLGVVSGRPRKSNENHPSNFQIYSMTGQLLIDFIIFQLHLHRKMPQMNQPDVARNVGATKNMQTL